MHILVLLEIILVIGLALLIGLAGLGHSAAHDHALKRSADTHLTGLVRQILGVYTRGS